MLSKLVKISEGLTLVSSEKFYIETIEELDRELEQAQVNQMLKGQTNNGSLIEPKYAAITRKFKANDSRYNAPMGTPNLLNKGDFQDDIFAKIEGNFVKWGSTDSKTPDLMDKYKNIFGLNDMSLEEFIKDVLTPVLIQKINGVFT